jgi:hypothetical protein
MRASFVGCVLDVRALFEWVVKKCGSVVGDLGRGVRKGVLLLFVSGLQGLLLWLGYCSHGGLCSAVPVGSS